MSEGDTSAGNKGYKKEFATSHCRGVERTTELQEKLKTSACSEKIKAMAKKK